MYQPAFDASLLAGPRLTAKLDARSRIVEPEIEEYSSSFFDEYDGPEEDEESEDDFDETTLWEIASLLKSKDVPSKNSLLPPARAKIEDYDYETEFESDSDDHSPIANSAFVTQLPIRPLESNSWRDDAKLWEPGSSSALEIPTGGIRQPDSQVWSIYTTDQIGTARVQSRTWGDLPIIKSRTLWTPPQPSLNVARESAMWQANPARIGRTTADLTTGVVRSVGLWVPLPRHVDAVTSGLFKVSAMRPPLRGTESALVTVYTVRASRAPGLDISIITSQNLWSPASHSNTSVNWLLKTSKVDLKRFLWAPSIPPQSEPVPGLFALSQKTVSNRASESPTAAMTMKRVYFKNHAPLRRLTSNTLWAGCDVLQTEHHWISESSTRPDSPSAYTEISSGSSSPASDSSSIKSSSTKASSLWGSEGSVHAPQCWDSKYSKDPALQSPHGMKVSIHSVLLGPLPEPRVFSSKDLWEAKNPVLEDNPIKIAHDNFTEHSPELVLRKPVHNRYRSALPSPADWDKALAEAIVAGSQPKDFHRPMTTPSDWADALSLAVSQSQIRLNHSTCGPKMWESALSEALAENPSKKLAPVIFYDVSVCHPVFFGAGGVISANEVHPAAYGYFVQSEARLAIAASPSMWNDHVQHISPVKTTVSAREPLWPHGSLPTQAFFPQNSTSIEQRAPMSPFSRGPSSNTKTVRARVRNTQTTSIRFRSVKLFSEAPSKSETKNWLRDTSLRSVSEAKQPLGMWTSKVSSSSMQVNNSMWTALPTLDLETPPSFPSPHSEPWFRNKREPASIARLESKKMWRRSTEVPEASRSWLTNRRASRVDFRY